jgi:hypothetical protein
MMLITIIVVMGINIFTCGLLMMISPGSRPKGTFITKGYRRPMMIRIAPIIIRIFCIGVNIHPLNLKCALFDSVFHKAFLLCHLASPSLTRDRIADGNIIRVTGLWRSMTAGSRKS